MTRYNLFNQIHKGLRSLLYETSLVLQQTDFLAKEEAKEAIGRVAEVVELFEKHAYTEDNFVLPALQEFEPSVVNLFEEEHDKDHALGMRLQELLFVFNHSVMDDTRTETGKTLNVVFVEFMVFNLEHMAKEEKVLNRLLWRYYSDEQLHGITQQILSQITPEFMAKYSRWMMHGLNNPEISGWLKQVKNTAPRFVFDGLMITAEKELHPHRWMEVREEVIDKAMVA
jgi:hemerythrin-like domain-containing protein